MKKLLIMVLTIILSLPISVWAVDNIDIESIEQETGIEKVLTSEEEQKLFAEKLASLDNTYNALGVRE